MSYSLTGKSRDNKFSLSGKNHSTISIPFEIQKLKIKIFNTILLPLFSKQWDIVTENMFLLEHYKSKIDFYCTIYKFGDLLLYKEILNIFDILIQQYNQVIDLEKQLYKTDSKNQVIQMVYRTAMIKLKPEYELYDNILGKPKKENNETYKENIIQDIQKYIGLENINYQKIKEAIIQKYG